MTEAAKLRHRVTFQEKVTSPDTYGQPIETWRDVVTVWASVEPMSGREYFAAQQVNSEVTARIRIRYRAGIRPDMRAVYGPRVFDLVSPPIDPEERHQELHVMCREVL